MKPSILLMMTLVGLLLVPCSANEAVESSMGQNEKFFIQSTIQSGQYAEIKSRVADRIGNTTMRVMGEEMTEAEAQELLQPLAVDGAEIRSQILESDVLEIEEEDIELLNSMTDCQLAELSAAINEIDDVCQGGELEVSVDDVVECFKYATGISDAGNLLEDFLKDKSLKNYYYGTKALISAKTGFQIAKSLARRYAGWVGVAWMVYDFGKCLHEKY